MCVLTTPAEHRVRIALFPLYTRVYTLPAHINSTPGTSPSRLPYTRTGKVRIVGTVHPLQDTHTVRHVSSELYRSRNLGPQRGDLSLLRRVHNTTAVTDFARHIAFSFLCFCENVLRTDLSSRYSPANVPFRGLLLDASSQGPPSTIADPRHPDTQTPCPQTAATISMKEDTSRTPRPIRAYFLFCNSRPSFTSILLLFFFRFGAPRPLHH